MEETPSNSNKKSEKTLQEEKENDANSSSISLTETTKSQFTGENKNIFVDNLAINKQQKDFEHFNINTRINNKFKGMAEKSEAEASQQKNNNNTNSLKSPPQPPPKTNVLSKFPWKRQQQPLVVIPKRRKHKNHISKRKGNRGGVLGSSMRNCVSDPQLYRGFNHWYSLCVENLKSVSIRQNEFSKKNNSFFFGRF
uniref:Uncharacterized protein n=1 Tax=Meloidogyne enterolobii TaxID=390850 RepID=A0A6V7U0H7_MELEN|nr:unnamed protein product [Meloidogyne enterolobii]